MKQEQNDNNVEGTEGSDSQDSNVEENKYDINTSCSPETYDEEKHSRNNVEPTIQNNQQEEIGMEMSQNDIIQINEYEIKFERESKFPEDTQDITQYNLRKNIKRKYGSDVWDLGKPKNKKNARNCHIEFWKYVSQDTNVLKQEENANNTEGTEGSDSQDSNIDEQYNLRKNIKRKYHSDVWDLGKPKKYFNKDLATGVDKNIVSHMHEIDIHTTSKSENDGHETCACNESGLDIMEGKVDDERQYINMTVNELETHNRNQNLAIKGGSNFYDMNAPSNSGLDNRHEEVDEINSQKATDIHQDIGNSTECNLLSDNLLSELCNGPDEKEKIVIQQNEPF